jgi:hypothetical protein
MQLAGSPTVYRKTKDIRLTQRIARHKSILTTEIYSHPTDEDLVRAVTGLPCWKQRDLAVRLVYWRLFVSAMRALISLRTSVAGNGLSG